METHKAARVEHTAWPGRNALQRATKGGQFALHSQSVQMVVAAFLANIQTTRELRQTHPYQRMALWEYGKDIDYLTHKSKQAHISSFTGSERGTSSRCPACGHHHKPKGRNWVCRKCRFSGHRDLVGSVNMHKQAYGNHELRFPRTFTYLRPSGKPRLRSSRADTPQSCLSESLAQPRITDTVSSETGHTSDVA